MKTIARLCLLVCLLAVCHCAEGQEVKILTNHLGYEPAGAKRAVVLGRDGDEVTTFKVIDQQNGKDLLSGAAVKAGRVDQWKDWCFWTADFSAVQTEGTYLL